MFFTLLPFLKLEAFIRLEDINRPEGDNVIFEGELHQLMSKGVEEVLDWKNPAHEWVIAEIAQDTITVSGKKFNRLVLRMEK